MPERATITISSKPAPAIAHVARELSQEMGIPVEGAASPSGPEKEILIGTVEDPFISRILQEYSLTPEDLGGLGDEGFLIRSRSRGVLVTGNSSDGAANGGFALLRELRKAYARDPFERKWDVRSTPRFDHRFMYISPLPWGLSKLMVDTWLLEDWKRHIEFLRSIGTNVLKIYIWPSQFYHPDYAETTRNQWLFEVYRQALAYARELGMESLVAFSYDASPPSVCWEHIDLRAVDSLYPAMTMCWSKGKDEILPFQRYVVEYFRDSVDGYVLWFRDPGGCECEECSADPSVVILDAIHEYQGIVEQEPGSRTLNLCTWHFYQIVEQMRRKGDSQFLDRVFSRLSPDTTIIDGHSGMEVLREARGRGFRTINFVFFLDPEGGLEDRAIFPRPLLREIDEVIAESERNRDQGIFAYRLTPYTRFISDYVFFRKGWDPGLSCEEIVHELAAQICPDPEGGAELSRAILLIDRWRQEKSTAQIREARDIVVSLRGTRSRGFKRLEILSDCLTILVMLVEYMESARADDEEYRAQFVEEMYGKMLEMWIFQAYSTDPQWRSRCKEMISQRIDWWTEGISAL